MKMKWVASAMMLALSATATAGGLLTNTNQNIVFCRNFAREGAIGIDGVYSNPAGVALLDTGFHLSLNLQSARQTRTVTSTFGPFTLWG
jgi:long-chain fatty acid transport protein